MRLAKDEEEALNMLFEVCMCEYTHALLQLDSKSLYSTISTKLQWQQCTSLDVLLWCVPDCVSSAAG